MQKSQNAELAFKENEHFARGILQKLPYFSWLLKDAKAHFEQTCACQPSILSFMNLKLEKSHNAEISRCRNLKMQKFQNAEISKHKMIKKHRPTRYEISVRKCTLKKHRPQRWIRKHKYSCARTPRGNAQKTPPITVDSKPVPETSAQKSQLSEILSFTNLSFDESHPS